MSNKVLYFILGAVGGAIVSYVYTNKKAEKQIEEIRTKANNKIETATDKMLYIANLAGIDIVDVDSIFVEGNDLEPETQEISTESPIDSEILREAKGIIEDQNYDTGATTDEKHFVYIKNPDSPKTLDDIMAEMEHPRDSEEENIYPEYANEKFLDESIMDGVKDLEDRTKQIENPADPYAIDMEMFDDESSNYEKIDLTFYTDDNVLIDETESPVSRSQTIGTLALEDIWGSLGFPEDTCGVRNEAKRVDYLITKMNRSYKETYYPDINPDDIFIDEDGLVRLLF